MLFIVIILNKLLNPVYVHLSSFIFTMEQIYNPIKKKEIYLDLN